RRRACEQLVKPQTPTPNIGARIHRQPAPLLRRHVTNRSHYYSWISLEQRPSRSFSVNSECRALSELCQSKVQNFQVSIVPHHYVLWLDVPMYYACCVRRRQSFSDLNRQIEYLAELQRRAR